jgi:hypothetical protein
VRANSPVNDFTVLNPVEDEPSIYKVTDEQKALVSASKSRDGKIILDHLQSKVDEAIYTLKHGEFVGMDPTTVAAIVIGSQQAIRVFEDVLKSVEISKQAVKDAAKQ